MFGHLDYLSRNCRDFLKYRCSLCHALAVNYGRMARFLTNDDMALCLAFVMGSNPSVPGMKQAWCLIGRKTPIFASTSPLMDLLSGFTVVLVAEKVKDDGYDENRRLPRLMHQWLLKNTDLARNRLRLLGVDTQNISEAFERQRLLEQTPGASLADLSGPTAGVMAEMYATAAGLTGLGSSAEAMGRIGRCLGQIIYLTDSLKDYADDVRHRRFNPLLHCAGREEKPGMSLDIPAEMKTDTFSRIRLNSNWVQQEMDALPLTLNLKSDIANGLMQMSLELEGFGKDCSPDKRNNSLQSACRWASVGWMLSPAVATAGSGIDTGTSKCAENTVFLVLMLMIYSAICRGCCGNSSRRGYDRVTVDHGCGGKKTYHRDSCSGEYRDRSTCC